MTNEPRRILTIIVPAYNMERCLADNLKTYVSPMLTGKISVIVLDNSSSDNTLAIARSFEDRYPDVFRVITKENNGYGSSVNMGMTLADGKYFKVIDADDFADTAALVQFVNHLNGCEADVVQTPYNLIDIKTGDRKKIPLSPPFETTDKISCIINQSPFPSLHTTTLRTDFVKDHPFSLLENAYYVDEELALYPFFWAKTVCSFDDSVYCYVVNNDAQSTSVKNKVKNREHRERIVKRMMDSLSSSDFTNDNYEFCSRRVARSVGDHFTTLYVLNSDKKNGRREAKMLSDYLKEHHPHFYQATKKKRLLLCILNLLHVSIPIYERLKKTLGYKEYSSL